MNRDLDAFVLRMVAKRLALPIHHARLSPEAQLEADLGLHQVDLISIACDIEEELGFMFPGDPELHWHQVADIVTATAEQLAAKAGSHAA